MREKEARKREKLGGERERERERRGEKSRRMREKITLS
jgi:hypothetical protein